jgi:TPR repeat protein
MQIARRDRLAFVLVAVYALGLGACVRHEETGYYGRVYGSLKDDPVDTRAVAKPAKVAAAVSAPPARVTPAAAPAAVVAAPPAEPAPPAPQASASVSISSSVMPDSAAVAEPPLPPDDEGRATAAKMLSDGEALFGAGKVVEARRLFTAAMNGPIPDAMLALARTYDTYHLTRLPSSDAAPDMQRALLLYERAMERGALNAAADLERTRAILKIPR